MAGISPHAGDEVVFTKDGVTLYGVVVDAEANTARVILVVGTAYLRPVRSAPAVVPIDPKVYNRRPVAGFASDPNLEVDHGR